MVVLRRRWYVMAVVIFATAVAGYLVDHPKHAYQATAILVLDQPVQPGGQSSLGFPAQTLATTGVAMQFRMTSPDVLASMRAAGVVGDVAVQPRNSGTSETPQYEIPAEQLMVTTSNPVVAMNSLDIVVSTYTRQLRLMQDEAKVPARGRIVADSLVAPNVAPLLGTKSRGVIGVALIGLMALFLLPIWFDQYARRRRRRRASGVAVRLGSARLLGRRA
jgi:hypothetical protein